MNGEDLREYVRIVQSRIERHEVMIEALAEKSEGRIIALAEKHEARMNALAKDLTELKIDMVKLMVRYSALGSMAGTAAVAIPAVIYWFVTK